MTVDLLEIEEFCQWAENDPGDSTVWSMLAAGICQAAETQPVQARQVIERLAASETTKSRVLAGLCIGPLVMARPAEEHEPLIDLWATLLNDAEPAVKREAERELLDLTNEEQLPAGVLNAVFKRMIEAI